MGFLKQHGVWVAFGVGLLAIIIVQIVVVGARKDAAREKNDEVARTYDRLETQVKNLSEVPTQADIAAAKEHITKIKAMGVEVRDTWRTLTGGLNAYMSNGEREDGTVLDPRESEGNRPIPATLFAQAINDLYNSLFEEMQTNLATAIEPKLATMIADSRFGASAKVTRADAEADGELLAKKRAPLLARILKPEKIIPVSLDERYDPPHPPEKMWRDWRAYLIARDIFGRVVPACEVEVPRSVRTVLPATEEERKELAREAAEAGASSDRYAQDVSAEEPPSVVRELKGWRFIEQVTAFSVGDLVPGNMALPGKTPTEGEEGTGFAGSPVPAPAPAPSPADPWSQFASTADGVPAVVEDRYHDTFTMEITLIAHTKVVRKFMSEVLRGDGIWYVPVSCTIKRLEGTSTENIDYETAERKRWETATAAGALEGVLVPPQTVPGFSHEPPVEATLTYNVLRFRFEDTDNPTAVIEESSDTSGGMMSDFNRPDFN